MQHLATRVITHELGFLLQELTTDDEKKNAALIEQEKWSLSVHALLAADALTEIKERYQCDSGDITSTFETDLISGDQAAAIARSLSFYWQEEWDASIHVVLPRIEAILRGMLREAGGIIYDKPARGRPGGVRSLGQVLRDIRPVMDESWWRFLWVLLVEPIGLNLRNEYLHGLIPVGTREHAALVIMCACYLRLLAVGPAPAPLPTPPTT